VQRNEKIAENKITAEAEKKDASEIVPVQ